MFQRCAIGWFKVMLFFIFARVVDVSKMCYWMVQSYAFLHFCSCPHVQQEGKSSHPWLQQGMPSLPLSLVTDSAQKMSPLSKAVRRSFFAHQCRRCPCCMTLCCPLSPS